MARGRKCSREKLTERLRELEEAIARQEEALGRLKAEKKECEKSLRSLETDELLDLMARKNLTVEDIKHAIDQTEPA
ncbi:MAG TPA: hypothetical protein IAA17_06925 [Candidatus Lachnoclostridium stercorigallinarum]|uniref:Flagellar export protein FliJ n=1 Tax=Candidatus Lachnoclostridium stercorigallinarum TaxID=2838634 RepID=A0A9D2GHW6_9FIRM|nr:hypothetical protein [Candidatus Lachnoclostridium stercorigallinarum]